MPTLFNAKSPIDDGTGDIVYSATGLPSNIVIDPNTGDIVMIKAPLRDVKGSVTVTAKKLSTGETTVVTTEYNLDGVDDTDTNVGTTVSLFVLDQSFINTQDPLVSLMDTGGIGRLDQESLSFFVNLVSDQDNRDPSNRVMDFVPMYKSALLMDAHFYSAFKNNLSAAPQATRDAIFAIIDRLAFHTTATDDTETFLTTDASTKDVYVAGSKSISTNVATGTYYNATSPGGHSYSCPTFVEFSANIPSGSTTIAYQITAYVDNSTWFSRYPNTTIMAIAPPVDYKTLLTTPLTGTMANMFATAADSARLNYQFISPAFATKTVTGYASFSTTVVDGETKLRAPFNIMYKGAVPSQLQMRNAVKNAVLDSGTGTDDQWKSRVPDLFVNARYYLMVPWDLTVQRPDQLLYTNIPRFSDLLSRMQKILPNVDSSTITTNLELFFSSYDRMPIAVMPDTSTSQAIQTLSSIYPTYQCYSTDETNFKYMTSDAQDFASTLADILAIATGQETNNSVYTITTDKGLSYYSFTNGVDEFCLITKDNYTALQNQTA